MAKYFLTVTIPKSHYRRIWENNFPDSGKIMGEYLFSLLDTYGLPQSCIDDLNNKCKDLLSQGHEVYLEEPKRGENE